MGPILVTVKNSVFKIQRTNAKLGLKISYEERFNTWRDP